MGWFVHGGARHPVGFVEGVQGSDHGWLRLGGGGGFDAGEDALDREGVGREVGGHVGDDGDGEGAGPAEAFDVDPFVFVFDADGGGVAALFLLRGYVSGRCPVWWMSGD